jgi:hypothetical protein
MKILKCRRSRRPSQVTSRSTEPTEVESTTSEFPARCLPRLSFLPQWLHKKRVRFIFPGKLPRSTDAISAVAPATSQAPFTLSQVPRSSPSEAAGLPLLSRCPHAYQTAVSWPCIAGIFGSCLPCPRIFFCLLVNDQNFAAGVVETPQTAESDSIVDPKF